MCESVCLRAGNEPGSRYVHESLQYVYRVRRWDWVYSQIIQGKIGAICFEVLLIVVGFKDINLVGDILEYVDIVEWFIPSQYNTTDAEQ